MTSLASWLGVDSRGPASIYLVSDSRISWGNGGGAWNHGRKLFACSRTPDLFGYCGDVVFASLVLSQITEMVDSGSLFELGDPSEERHSKLLDIIKDSFSSYPHQDVGFSILHCSRDGEKMESEFSARQIRWHPNSGWSSKRIGLPDKSDLLIALGSGQKSVRATHLEWQDTELEGTSRSVFSAFVDSVQSGVDPLSGGPPQLVSLYRIGQGNTYGIIHEGKRFLYGLPVREAANINDIEWRNELLEICDGATMKRKKGAQKHSRPASL